MTTPVIWRVSLRVGQTTLLGLVTSLPRKAKNAAGTRHAGNRPPAPDPRSPTARAPAPRLQNVKAGHPGDDQGKRQQLDLIGHECCTPPEILWQARGNRTPNLRFWRPTLCQLSYTPGQRLEGRHPVRSAAPNPASILPPALLDDLGDDAGADGTAAFADRKTQTFFHRDRLRSATP
jgi:hypothetical protein